MNVRVLLAGVASALIATVLFMPASVYAQGEKYEWPIGSKNSLSVSGGNIGKMGIPGGKISLPVSSTSANEFVIEQTTASVCDDYGARISVWVNLDTDKVTSVNAFCESESGEELYADWSLSTVTSPTPPKVDPIDDPRVENTTETYSFVGKEGKSIRACKGVWYQFNATEPGCVTFNGGTEGADGLLTYSYSGSPLTDDCGGTGGGNYTFQIQLTEPREIVDDKLPGTVYWDSQGGCNINLKNIGERPQAASIVITNADQLESLGGQPVETEPEDPESLCQVTGGMAWILCPIMNTVASINDEAYKLIENFLQIPPMMTDGSNTGAFQVWSSVRNIANVLFAIAFIFIVYSQLTSAGISNYGIKKMLPKLLVGVILVNISFWIVALMVDLSNVIGSSIYEVMKGFIPAPADGTLNSWQGVTGEILGNGALLAGIAGGAVMIGFSVLLPLGISALFMLVGLLFILTFRHAMVFILAVIAPLAFVAYLLPNTEGMFKSWFKLFRVLLYIYPAVGFIMGASQVAAAVVFATAQEAEAGVTKLTMMLIAVAMPAMGIFAALMLAKTMGSVMSKLGVQNPFSGVINAAKERAGATGRNMDGATSNWMAGRRGFRRIGGVGQARREARDFKQQMRDNRYKNDAQARALGQQRKSYIGRKEDGSFGLLNGIKGVDKASLNTQLDASKQNLSRVQTEAEITAMRTNEDLHVNAQIQQLGLDSSKQQMGDSAASEILTNSASAAIAGGTMAGGAQRAVDFAQARVDKRQDELVENARSRMGSTHVDELFDVMQDEKRSVEERAAAARQIATRGGDQHVQEMVNYMAENHDGKDMKPLQILSAEAAQKRKSAAWGNTDYSNLARGDLKKTYNESMMSRLQAGKIGANELMSMGNDDRIRIAQLAKERPEEMAKVMPDLNKAIDELKTNDNTKDRLTPEMLNSFEDIQSGNGPRKNSNGSNPLQNLEFERTKKPAQSTPSSQAQGELRIDRNPVTPSQPSSIQTPATPTPPPVNSEQSSPTATSIGNDTSSAANANTTTNSLSTTQAQSRSSITFDDQNRPLPGTAGDNDDAATRFREGMEK